MPVLVGWSCGTMPKPQGAETRVRCSANRCGSPPLTRTITARARLGVADLFDGRRGGGGRHAGHDRQSLRSLGYGASYQAVLRSALLSAPPLPTPKATTPLAPAFLIECDQPSDRLRIHGKVVAMERRGQDAHTPCTKGSYRGVMPSPPRTYQRFGANACGYRGSAGTLRAVRMGRAPRRGRRRPRPTNRARSVRRGVARR